MAAAGLGLYSYQNVAGGVRGADDSSSTVHEDSARVWLNEFKTRYCDVDAAGNIQNTTTYFDPELDYHNQAAGIFIGFGVAWYVLPQDPVLARELYDAVKTVTGWPGTKPNPGNGLEHAHLMSILGLLLAQEFGDEQVVNFLRHGIYNVSELKECGDFESGYYFHRGENWPRGQMSALLTCSHLLSKGQWTSFFNRTPEEHASQHGGPTVVGVDYPFLALSDARFVDDNTALLIATYPATRHHNLSTKFQVTQLPNVERNKVTVECDGQMYDDWSVLTSTSIEIVTATTERIFYVRYGGVTKL